MTELRHLLGLLGPPGAWDAAAPATADGNAPALNPQALNPQALNPQALNPQALNPQALNPQALNPQALSPQPGLGQLSSLIGPVTATGLPVELHVTGTQRGLPPGLDLAAFRVIQEALTNVIKHAGQARAEIRLDYRPAELLVEIADDGTGGSAGSTPGRGLLGLRERVELYGGDLDAGLRPGGGWLVRARIPVDLQAADAASVAGLAAEPAPPEPALPEPHPAATLAGPA